MILPKTETEVEEEEEQLIDIENLGYKEIEQKTEQEFGFIYQQLKRPDKDQLNFKLFFLLKQLLTKKYANIPWDMLEELFYKDKNVLRRYILIKTFITQNAICDNRKCFTNLNLDNVAKWINSLPTGCYDLKNAKVEYGADSANYKDYVNIIERCSRELTIKFQEIHKIFAMKNAHWYEQERSHKRSLEKLRLMGELGIPYSKTVGKDVDADIDEDEKYLMPNTPEFQEEHGIFKEEQANLLKNKNRGVERHGQ